jgi:hypothetical protein
MRGAGGEREKYGDGDGLFILYTAQHTHSMQVVDNMYERDRDSGSSISTV